MEYFNIPSFKTIFPLFRILEKCLQNNQKLFGSTPDDVQYKT